MSSSNLPYNTKSYIPPVSAEDKSFHYNIDINKYNLEKGLRNRPNQVFLVDRGILLNPGKAYSDKMHQLDLAKKRDRLKKKIENRPDREELVRKLILQGEEFDCRKNEINRIKQMLDSSINTRPGSLELVDKNILQVDRLLASKVHNGDISYPKVCLEDITSLPPILETGIQSSLNDLSDILSQSSGKSSTSKIAQISSKKTCRVGRYSFHNIEFRPTAQKAREFQQNELLEYEKIQAQHDPSLKRVHSELALKSRNITDCRSDKYRPSKYSLLHRLNVHELKSECKLRLIACSNIPKMQLVEKLLPFEAEILRSHTSFDQSKIAHRYSANSQSVSDFSPPDPNLQSNLTPPPSISTINSPGNVESFFSGETLTKICHSISEPTIQNYNSQPNVMSPIQLTFVNNPRLRYYNDLPHYEHFNPNNSYPLVNGNSGCSHQSCSALLTNAYIPQQLSPENAVFHGQPYAWNSNHPNGFESKLESKATTSLPESYFKPMFLIENSQNFSAENPSPSINSWSNELSASVSPGIKVPSIPADCIEKFEMISKDLNLLKSLTDKINAMKSHKTNYINMQSYLEDFKSVRERLVKTSSLMIEFVNMELKFRRIDPLTAGKQSVWLNDLLELINNDFNDTRYESSDFNGLELLSVGDDDCDLKLQNNGLDDMDMLDFFNTESTKAPSQSTNSNIFLKDAKFDSLWRSPNTYGQSDLKTPETPFSEIGHSPMSTDDLDHIMNSLLDCSDDQFT